MSKERIFELVRNEEILLFIGAGMSRYAGYPSGAELAEILHKNLPSDLREHIDLTYDLSKIADDIYQVKGRNRNYLLDTIKKQFDKTPDSLETHKLLARIPHFKTIITTNYDDLIERTNKNIDIVRKNSDYSYTAGKKQILFKIHGDFTDKDSIIVTKTDYTKYFSQDKDQTVFWNAIKDRLASNHILFIGYSLDDSNILTIIEKILNELGEHRKEMFFAAPSVTHVKLHALRNNGIEFIESTGEDLIDEIYKDLQLNYFTNLKDGQGTATTALNFAKENGLNISIKHNGNSIDIDIPNRIGNNFELKFDVEMPNETEKLWNDFINNKNFDSVVLTNENVKDLNIFESNFRVLNDKVNKLEIRKLPGFSEIVDIVFEDDFELDSFPIEMYVINPEKDIAVIKLNCGNFEIVSKINIPAKNEVFNIETTVTPTKPLKNLAEGIRFYEGLHRLTTNVGFKVFKGAKFIYGSKFLMQENDVHSKNQLKYLSDLKSIERHFNIKFLNIDLNDVKVKTVEKILSFINKNGILKKFNGGDVTIENEDEINRTLKIEYGALIISEREPLTVHLHGNDFNIGYIHQVIYDSYVVNKEELIAKKTQNVHFKSKTDSIYIYYSKDEEFVIKDKS